MSISNGALYLEESIKDFRSLKKICEIAIEQLSDEEFRKSIDIESNSIALIMKHIAGNLKSRWRDFLTADGEKPDRNRDSEFSDSETKDELISKWEMGWKTLFDTLESLTENDLQKIIYIRGQSHTVIKAIVRAESHIAYHAGQIVYLAKHLKWNSWKNLSVPKGKSNEYNKENWGNVSRT